mgnify:CR=1 FL=1
MKQDKKGDKYAFIELIEQCRGAMVQTAVSRLKNKEDVEDAIQESIVTAFKNIGNLRDNSYFKTWLIRIMVNTCSDIIKKESKYVDLNPYLEENMTDSSDTAKSVETKHDVESVMSALKENDRLILNLLYSQDMSVKQISEVLGLSENAVKLRISRGREKFKKIYADKEAVCV